MKKAKIFLTVLTVLTVVGGALAFKAKEFNTFASCDLQSKKCIVDPFHIQIATTLQGASYGFDIEGVDCKVKPDGSLTCSTLTTFNG